MPTTTCTVQEIKKINALIEPAIKKALEGSGFTIENLRGTYGDACKTLVNFKRAGAAGEKDAKKEWDRYCKLFGLKPDQYKHWLWPKNEDAYRLQLVGFSPNRKFSVMVIEEDTGKKMSITQEYLAQMIKAKRIRPKKD